MGTFPYPKLTQFNGFHASDLSVRNCIWTLWENFMKKSQTFSSELRIKCRIHYKLLHRMFGVFPKHLLRVKFHLIAICRSTVQHSCENSMGPYANRNYTATFILKFFFRNVWTFMKLFCEVFFIFTSIFLLCKSNVLGLWSLFPCKEQEIYNFTTFQ